MPSDEPKPFPGDTLHDGPGKPDAGLEPQPDAGPEPQPDAGAPDEPPDAPPGAELFGDDQVLTIHLELAAADLQELDEYGNQEIYKPASVSIEGSDFPRVELGQVGLRHKGAYTLHHCWESGERDYTGECAKLSYKLDFAEYDAEGRVDGLKRLNLHASSGDDTRLRELMAYDAFRAFGVAAPRTAVANVFVNGAPRGLFIVVENIDGRFTKAHFPAGGGDGNLYKEVWPSPMVGYTALVSALTTNEEVGDVSAFSAFAGAVATSSVESFVTAMEPWVDLEHTLRYIAVDRALKNWDGIMGFYSPSSPHNFFWYHDGEGSGRFQLIPWDMDNALWPFDPFMAPEEWVTAAPVPDWNSEPANCDPRPVWDAWSNLRVTPPRCDRFLDRLAETKWSRFAELAHELAAGSFAAAQLRERAQHYANLIAPIIAEDPFISATEWEMEVSDFDLVLDRASSDLSAFANAGLISEAPAQ